MQSVCNTFLLYSLGTVHIVQSNSGIVRVHRKLTPVIYLLQSLINIVSPRPSVRIEHMVPTDEITLQAPTQCSKTFTLPVPSSGNQPPAAIHCLHLSYHVRKVYNYVV